MQDSWPANVRELVKMAVRLRLPPKEELEKALADARGNLTQLAERSGWHRTQIYRWMKKYALEIDDYR